jgi:hypothetical protein
MKDATTVLAPASQQGPVPPSVTLALQRVRQTWRLLGLVGLGMLTAVMLVSAVPLYARVAMTASLRTTLASSSQSTDIVVRGQTNGSRRRTMRSHQAISICLRGFSIRNFNNL